MGPFAYWRSWLPLRLSHLDPGSSTPLQFSVSTSSLVPRCLLSMCLTPVIRCWLVQATYGKGQGLRWLVYWRLFYLACSELFAYNGGTEWFVGHYLFSKKA